ncbi:MAG: GNAT family N-acetyltransferase [Amaricoccus sp.]
MTARSAEADMTRIAPMSYADLDGRVLEWAAAEGWNPGLDDAEAFLAADPAGFLMAWVGDEPVAAISAVRHSPSFGFLGLYLCRPEWRGRGHGQAIWQAGLAHLGDRTVGLDGVVAQQTNYARAGFVLARRTVRHHGSLAAEPSPRVVPCRPEHLPAMLRLDAQASGVERTSYLQAWFAAAPARQTLVLEADGGVVGYGTIRACRSGAKVGPLHAADPADAELLLKALAAFAPPGGGLYLDIPEPNYAAISLVRELGFTPVFETARMYRGPAPDEELATVFGEVTLELG